MSRNIFVSLLAFLLVSSVVIVADQSGIPPFQFDQHEQMEVSWSDLVRTGVSATLVNNELEERDIVLQLSGFLFEDKAGNRLSDQDVLSLESNNITLDLSQDVHILGIQGAPHLATGRYDGYVVATDAESGFVSRLDLLVSVSEEESSGVLSPEGVLPAPLFTIWSARYIRWIPFSSEPAIVFGRFLPLDVSYDESCSIALRPNTPLGYLAGQRGGLAEVFWTGNCEQDGQLMSLELGFAELWQSGVHNGKVNLLPGDSQVGEVKLSVSTTDVVFWPILAIILGVVFAGEVQHTIGVKRPILMLHEQVLSKIEILYKEANAEFLKISEGESFATYTVAASLLQERTKLLTEIEHLRKGRRLSVKKLDEDRTFKQITEQIKSLSSCVAEWAPFAAELKELRREVKELDYGTYQTRPAFLERCEFLLTGGELAVAEGNSAPFLSTRRSEVQEALQLVKSWPELLERTSNLLITLQKIENVPAHSRVLYEDLVSQAKLSVAEVSAILWEAPDRTSLEDYGALRLLNDTERRVRGIEQLKHKLPYLRDPGEWRGSASAAVVEYSRTFLYGYRQPTSRSDVSQRLAQVRTSLRRSDVVIFSISLVVAVITALYQLYIGKDFGSFTDYLNAFIWGFSTRAVLEIVYTGANWLAWSLESSRTIS